MEQLKSFGWRCTNPFSYASVFDPTKTDTNIRVHTSVFELFSTVHTSYEKTIRFRSPRENDYRGPVHTNPFSFENAYFCDAFSSIVHTNTIENGYLDPRKRKLSKTPSKVETFENGCLSYQWGRAKTPKTKVLENADVMNSILDRFRLTT